MYSEANKTKTLSHSEYLLSYIECFCNWEEKSPTDSIVNEQFKSESYIQITFENITSNRETQYLNSMFNNSSSLKNSHFPTVLAKKTSCTMCYKK